LGYFSLPNLTPAILQEICRFILNDADGSLELEFALVLANPVVVVTYTFL